MTNVENDLTKKVLVREVLIYRDTFTVDDLQKIKNEKISLVLPEFKDSCYFEAKKYFEMYDPGTYFGVFFCYKDYETDEEFEKRVSLEQEEKKRKEDYERREFERLSKKFNT